MGMRTDSDDRLAQRLRQGDEAALGEIIERYTAYVGAIVWNILSGKQSREDAAEVVSDSFYTLWQNAEKVQPGKLKAYLACIARSRALNALRRAKQDLPLEEDTIHLTVDGPEDEAMRRAESEALRRSLDAMGEPDRTIFIRHYYWYQTAAEIAAAMGINSNTIQTKLRRGRQRLKAELTEGGFLVG